MRLVPLASVALSSLVSSVAAQSELYKLEGSLSQDQAAYGRAVAADGPLAVVGAPSTTDTTPGEGRAFVVDTSTGTELFELADPAPLPAGVFGRAVEIGGGRVFVGAPRYQIPYIGHVHVFDATTGQHLLDLVSPNGHYQDHFGLSVSFGGDRLIVGSEQENVGPAIDRGAAYVFDAATGGELAYLTAADGEHGDGFGRAVALAGERAIVSAPRARVDGVRSGAVYVLDVSTGAELFRLGDPDLDKGNFGWSIAVRGNRLLVGVPADSTVLPSAGSAYLYDLPTGTLIHKLFAPDAHQNDGLGVSVELTGELALVGSSGDNDQGHESGSAYVFHAETGRMLYKLRGSDGAKDTKFGWAIAAGTTIVSGAPSTPPDGRLGAAYVFSIPQLVGASYCGPAPQHSGGESARLRAWGSETAAEGALALVADRLPTDEFGYFLTSPTAGFVPNPGGSEGNLCLAGAIGRYRKDLRSSGPQGALHLTLDLSDMPPFHAAVLPGETWHFQAWFRDHNPQSTSNFTDGLAVSFL